MSTRIYRGFMVREDSLALIAGIVDEFRPWVEKQAQKQLDSFMKNVVTEGGTEQKAWGLWQDRRRALRLHKERDPAVDTDFSLSFLPAKGDFYMEGEVCLGICYTEHDKWFERWLKMPRVSEYGYWNNTDKPRRVSAKEWAERGRVWDATLGHKPVIQQAYSIDLVDDLLLPTKKEK